MNGVLNRINWVLETFNDLGKLSKSKLEKGQRLDPQKEDNFTEVNGRVFYKSISKIKVNDIARGDEAKGLKSLSVYSVNDYNKMKCYLGKNNSSGYCVAHGDELVSLFSSQKSSGSALVVDAIKNGAKRLDCFAIRKNGKISGDLHRLYSKHGFKIDTNMNKGVKGEPYAIVNGVSDYVDDKEIVHPENKRVVIFMKR